MHTDLPTGIRIEYDIRGPASAPPIVLIMGLGMQLIAWPVPLLEGLAARGWRVLRFDNRDAGLSSRVETRRPIDLRAAMIRSMLGLRTRPAYTLEDMAADTAGLMDALGMASAHVVGVSMGGMIGQVLAAKMPHRVRSLTSIMSSSGALRFRFHVSPATRALLSRPPRGATEAQLLAHSERVWGLIGSPGMRPDPAELRERLRKSMARGFNPMGVARQILAIMDSGDRRPLLRTIRVPTLVMHGDLDPLIPIAAGRDTAAHVPGATFRVLHGMGHDLPDPMLPTLVEAIAEHCARAEHGAGER